MPRQPPPERRNEPVYQAPRMPRRQADSTKTFEGIEVGKTVNSKAGLHLECLNRFRLGSALPRCLLGFIRFAVQSFRFHVCQMDHQSGQKDGFDCADVVVALSVEEDRQTERTSCSVNMMQFLQFSGSPLESLTCVAFSHGWRMS